MSSEERKEENANTHTHTNLDDSYDMPDNSPTMTRNKTKITITASTSPPLCWAPLWVFTKKRSVTNPEQDQSTLKLSLHLL